MPTNYSLPNQGQYTFTDYIGINSADPNTARRHIFPSILQNGGFQEMPETVDMHEIPVEITGAGFGTPKITMDGFGSGRRRIGMLVHVLAEQKIYKLIPQGFYGNGGNNGLSEWNALTDTQKYELLSPTATYNASYTPPNNYTESTPTGAAGDCWVELEFGSDGNPISAIDYTEATGSLKTTLTHDGSGAGTPIEFEVFVDNYTSALADTSTNVPTAVGGFTTSDTVASLNSLTQNQMWDKLLFPTVNPVGSSAGCLINDVPNYVLKTAGETVSFTLETSATQGTLSSPSGPWAGPVNAALIEDISAGGVTTGPFNPAVTPPIGIADVAINGYEVALGSNKWRLTASFDQGVMPTDSTGADYPGARFAAQDKTNTTDFEGVYPIKLGDASGNGNFVNRGLVSHGANNINCSQVWDEPADGSIRHRIAISNAMIAGRSIMIQQWNDVGGQYADVNMATEWTESSTQYNIEGNSINYTLFTKLSAPGGGDVGNNELYNIKF